MAVTLLGVKGSKEKKITVVITRTHQQLVLRIIWNNIFIIYIFTSSKVFVLSPVQPHCTMMFVKGFPHLNGQFLHI